MQVLTAYVFFGSGGADGGGGAGGLGEEVVHVLMASLFWADSQATAKAIQALQKAVHAAAPHPAYHQVVEGFSWTSSQGFRWT